MTPVKNGNDRNPPVGDPMAQMTQRMPLGHLHRLTIMAAGILSVALMTSQPAPAATSYPWCVSGEELHCYYVTREQCEEAVDYHGFCEMNPDNAASNSAEPRRPH
jgi:Protein of unknown function (DUF3551)